MANNILKIKRTYKPHRFESIDPWRYKGKWIMEPRAKKKKKKRTRNA